MRQARQHVDAPAEVLCSVRRGSDPQVQRRARSEVAGKPAQAIVQQRRARWPNTLEARSWGAWGEHQLEGEPRRVRGHQHSLIVDRHDPLTPAYLLGDEIAEKTLTHRARGV